MAPPNFPAHLDGSLTPETLRLSAAAFSDAWLTLEARGISFTKYGQADAARDFLAKAIIAAVKLGERDEAQLRDAALASWAKQNARHPREPTQTD